jgi:hypothetical protein
MASSYSALSFGIKVIVTSDKGSFSLCSLYFLLFLYSFYFSLHWEQLELVRKYVSLKVLVEFSMFFHVKEWEGSRYLTSTSIFFMGYRCSRFSIIESVFVNL